MTYDFNTLVNRSDKYSRKWERMGKRKEGMAKNIPPFSVADTDFEYPQALRDGFIEYSESMIFGYSRPDAHYYQAFIDWVNRRHHYEIDRSWILDSNGVVPAIYNAIHTFSKPNEGVMIMTPVYPPFKQSIIDTERTVVNVPLKRTNDRYEMDLDLFEKEASKPENKMLILCSPHNPVGRVWTKHELEALSSLCEKHDIFVVSDEIHMDLILKGHHHHVYTGISDYAFNNSMVLTAASKTFNIAGAQTSMTIIPNEKHRVDFERVLSRNAFFGVNAFGFKLAEIAYTQCEDWLDELLVLIEENHNLLMSFIEERVEGVKAFPIEGTYLQWLDFSGLKMSDEQLFDFLIDDCDLFLTAGVGYGEGGSQFLRWNIATPKDVLEAGLRRLENGLKKLMK